MLIRSPQSLHYPITVTALLVTANQEIKRSTPLFSYTFESTRTITDEFGEDQQETINYPAEYRAENDGVALEWKIAKNDVIRQPEIALLEIEEPCKHEVQFAGMCTVCGKDMTEVDFMTTSTNDQRATINMVHGNVELKISEDEAYRANEVTTRRLLANKKLSLVVDLDQTIIHAVCDPTVADWQKDESNPNYEAVKDVQSFELVEDAFNSRPCSYYIKMRPGLREFLDHVADFFELHIYTMGTRSYAEHVAKIVDPDGRIFGDRILSRDESGSMTAKSLHRLFPVDTKMVVIIDDRGDVWAWSPNLIRVRAFNFYVGIGDINSSFLPKRIDAVSPTAPVLPSPPETKEEEQAAPVITENGTAQSDGAPSIEEQLILMAGGNDPSILEEQSHKQQEEIAAQVQERPLLKKQELLDNEEAEKESNHENGTDTAAEYNRVPLLQNDDIELRFLQEILQRVHTNFFTMYEKQMAGATAGRVAQLRGEKKKKPVDDLQLVPDIKDVMPRMKHEVLDGVVICFTGLIPQGMVHERSDLGTWARSFGARVSPNLTKSTTHVVADRDRRTSKVRQAAKHPHIRIVDKMWLFECFSRWTRVDEDAFIIAVEPATAMDENGNDNNIDDARHVASLPADVVVGGGRGEDDLLLPPLEDDDDDLSASTSAAAAAATYDLGLGGASSTVRNGLVDGDGLGEDDGDEDDLPESPIEEMLDEIDWNEFDDEMNEFLDSEGTQDSEAEDDPTTTTTNNKNNNNYNNNNSGNSSSNLSSTNDADITLATRKRKLAVVDDNIAAADAADRPGGSRLEQRKKRAFERTTSLTQVATAEHSSGLPSPEATTGEDKGEAKKRRQIKEEEEADAEMEREMMAAFEDDDEFGDG